MTFKEEANDALVDEDFELALDLYDKVRCWWHKNLYASMLGLDTTLARHE